MKMRLVQALLLMVVILALVNVASTATSWTTPGPHGLNLNGKMFTLSLNRGGISFFPPSWPSTPSSTTSPYYSTTKRSYSTTKHPYTTTRHHHPTTKRSYSTTKRSYSTTKHPYTTTRHHHPTTRHHHPTTKRSYSTTKHPYTTTRHHHPTTKRSYSTTKHPYTTTRHHHTTPKRPHTTTTRPHTTTTRPHTTTRHHHPTTKRSYSTTKHPYTTTTRPNTTTTRPHTTTTRPNTTTTRPHTTTTRPHTTTTAPSVRGVSVCLRYLTNTVENRLFTVSPSRMPLQVTVNQLGYYTLRFNSYGYNTLYMKPSIRFWSNIGPDIWSRVCFTLDSMKNVAQAFSGSNISIRMLLPYQYVWSGEPVIEFPGFDGQLTDVQMWDYPLSYREVFKYMNNGVYGPHHGSVLTWSSINYTPSGNTLLEDVYEWEAKQQISGRRRGRRPKGGRKNRKFVNVVEREEGIRDLL
ncbi:mucin-5AC-like [Acanthopagrus latus]|uniref:mucin-5AC-like n=1 Tax=Acanthopagrus latus TaxID=8177 RepID=UPI00187CAFE7|nr:mucin-5AC-like [Acanthopagrus latus]